MVGLKDASVGANDYVYEKEIVDNQFRKNLRKGGTDRQKDNIVSFIKDVIYK